ncbi:Hsp70 family protein [Schaalia suimastitidis]|uniref:Hsp70 family protein n=1 Tax=Schaalia suimastitidis TaxID=121163 RepID=UPI000401D139|nr:Hsp70 family protein [Schaalia suimastitidis]
MRFGVDFGTSRTTIASCDRGNYPVVSFEDHQGDIHDYIPSIAALDGDHLVFGFQAQALAAQGAPALRSFKRLLSDPQVTEQTTIRLARRDIGLLDLVTRYLAHVADTLRYASSATSELGKGPLEAVIGIPAHAHSGQRFLTLEAFRNAGWHVHSMINEPSAAGFEYTHRHGGTLNSKRTSVLVYDLGGGTFDASLVHARGTSHEVQASRGHNMLGGDDFDLVLAHVTLQVAGIAAAQLGDAGWAELVEQCRIAKESLNAQTRFLTLEVQGKAISVPVAQFYDAATCLVEETFTTMLPLLHTDADGDAQLGADIAGLYVVGGGAELPLVSRLLRTRFGRRVHRSPHGSTSTAIGLAIAADPDAAFTLRDTLARGVGVFREGEAGAQVTFDRLLTPDMRLNLDGTMTFTRTYKAAHNVGWFRFVEYSRTDEAGVPSGDVLPYGELRMPFDPHLQHGTIDLSVIAVERTFDGPRVQERYRVDTNGIIDVEIVDLDTGYSVRQGLGHPH